MLGTHALIGVGEAVITVAAVSAVLPPARTSSARRDRRRRMKLFTIIALAARDRARHRRLAVRVHAARRARTASPTSTVRGAGRPSAAPIADYAFPGVDDERLATGLAGFTGTLLVFALGFGVVKLARRRPARMSGRSSTPASPGPAQPDPPARPAGEAARAASGSRSSPSRRRPRGRATRPAPLRW